MPSTFFCGLSSLASFMHKWWRIDIIVTRGYRIYLAKRYKLAICMVATVPVVWCVSSVAPYGVTSFDPHTCTACPAAEE